MKDFATQRTETSMYFILGP
uniref:Uncharacterized protein n=1 Tax=Heterorhabditis bacteriophora TaxID=37862 RepID=A0A1I7WVU6_HETBA